MELLTPSDREQLLANAVRSRSDPDYDPMPVVKLHIPYHPAIWLLTELDPREPHIAYGLCDLGLGFPEIGSVDLRELTALRVGPTNLVKRDARFQATKTLRAYAEEARAAGRILV